ncbi:MAG: hypothetical protein WC799_24635 [Desulfobacteraceae bacterium]
MNMSASMNLLFAIGISIAKLSGNWQNEISNDEYLHYGIQSSLPYISDERIDPKKMEDLNLLRKKTSICWRSDLKASGVR